MILCKQAVSLKALLARHPKDAIGFVPTMGALHEGHLQLIHRSRAEGGLTVCSIFVNPTQFNNPDDLKHYPVTLEQDIRALAAAGCDYLFLPSVSEIYPPGYTQAQYDLGAVEGVLEGAYRPGHFQGVAAVVHLLLGIVAPARLYLGQKDWQQCVVVARLLHLTGLDRNIRLITVPTVRERDGLAMSSRNLRLSAESRRQATALYRALLAVADGHGASKVVEREKKALEAMGFAVDYLEVRSSDNLLHSAPASGPRIALVAATIGGVRLIDNLLLP